MTLVNQGLHSENMPDLAVLYDTEPGAILHTLLQLLRAHNPYMQLPATAVDWDPVLALAGDRDILTQVRAYHVALNPLDVEDVPAIASAASAATAAGGGAGTVARAPDPIRDAIERLASFTDWVSLMPISRATEGYLFRAPVGEGPFALPDPASARWQMGLVAQVDELLANRRLTVWPKPVDVDSIGAVSEEFGTLVRLWLTLRYGAIRQSPWLTGKIEVPNLSGAGKTHFIQVTRAARMLTLAAVLLEQEALFDLRHLARLMLMAGSRALRSSLADHINDEIDAKARWITGLPLHPWLAEAERVLLPASRATRWAKGSPTLGLPRSTYFAQLDAILEARREAPLAPVSDLRGYFGGTLAQRFLNTARAFKRRYDTLDDDMRRTAEQLMGFEGTKPPAAVGLYSVELKPTLSDASFTSEPVPDLCALLTRPILPAANADGTSIAVASLIMMVFDNATLVQARAVGWGSVRHALMPAQRSVPVFINPSSIELNDDTAFQQISPAMLAELVDESFWGEAPITRVPLSNEGTARSLSVSSIAAVFSNPSFMSWQKQLSRWFAPNGTVNKPLPYGLYVSDRTRETWKVRVDLITDAVPRKLIAFNIRTAPTMSGVGTYVSITPQQPTLNSPLEPVLDAALRLALGPEVTAMKQDPAAAKPKAVGEG